MSDTVKEKLVESWILLCRQYEQMNKINVSLCEAFVKGVLQKDGEENLKSMSRQLQEIGTQMTFIAILIEEIAVKK